MQQKMAFCTAPDGVRICYSLAGNGPPLVKAPNWLGHLEFEWQSPIWRHWWSELAQDFTLVRFDQRGCGLSDWNVPRISFDDWVSDLETVIEATGLQKFDLLGISQGGSVAVEFAARHPELVRHLVLYGAYTRGWAKRGGAVEERRLLLDLTRFGWGRDNPGYRQVFTYRFMPRATPEQMDWFNELQRVSTSPENAAAIQAASGQIDILDRLSHVQPPTLVLHCQRDASVPFDQGRQLAALIPNARLVPLDSENHLLIGDEPAWRVAVSEVRSFLSGSPPGAPGPAAPEVQPLDLPNGLTRREADVLRLIAAGKSNREIAEALFLSPKTVAQHVTSILNKTTSANRAEAAAFAARQGLV